MAIVYVRAITGVERLQVLLARYTDTIARGHAVKFEISGYTCCPNSEGVISIDISKAEISMTLPPEASAHEPKYMALQCSLGGIRVCTKEGGNPPLFLLVREALFGTVILNRSEDLAVT